MYTLGCFQCAFCRITFRHVAIYLHFCASNVFGGAAECTLGPGDPLGRALGRATHSETTRWAGRPTRTRVGPGP